MRLLTIPVALALSVLCTAYPQPLRQGNAQQQLAFDSFRPESHNNDNNNINNGYARFDDQQVLRVEVSSMEELKKLEATVEDKNLDLWSNLRIGTVDVRIPSSEIAAFKVAIPFPSTVMIPNLQDLLPEQAPALTIQSSSQGWNYTDDSFWQSYHDLATLNNFTESMVQQFPELVKRTSMGFTYEGREVFGMTIHGYKRAEQLEALEALEDSVEELVEDVEELVEEASSWLSWLFGSSSSSKSSKPKIAKKPSKPKKHPKAIVIHGGQHAREWIGPAVVSYIAKELILGYGNSKKITRLVDQFEFTIVPVLNVDGYAYTWEHNRMWRKNRQPTSIPFCPGIDPNRNWGYKFATGGSSANPCSDAYHGPEAFAAKEPKMIADYVLQKENVVGYIDFHSYSQLWMTPFGADCSKIPKDDEDIMEAGMGAAKALKDVHGKKFAVGSVCKIIYQASGGSLDWTYAEGGVKYSYAVELRDTGRHGFLLPEDEILPSSEETFAGVLHLANFIRKREKQWRYWV
ncbi:Carboxypeptidase A4 [Linnemannia exigua]|uniref:Carboxypeptidase M14A n=1 Tax=Linnemannia exigua TaxID=604196 RepID=A0AAD4H6B7_9FUNG|nr:Carboxypeptidase A4 [Linnemannia exigua]